MTRVKKAYNRIYMKSALRLVGINIPATQFTEADVRFFLLNVVAIAFLGNLILHKLVLLTIKLSEIL